MFAKQSTARTFLVGPILDADGVAKTDEAVGSIKVTKNGTVGAADAQSTLTHDHTGHYLYVATDGDDFDTLGEVSFSLNSGTNAMSPVTFQVVPANVYDSLVSGTDLLDGSVVQILGTALTETDGYLAAGFKKFFNVETPTGTLDSLPDAVPGAAGGLFIAGQNAATGITTALTANVIGALTGSLSGSVGSVTGAVGSVTGAVGSVTGAVGSVTGAVGSIGAGGIVAASFAANSITASALKADAATEIGNAVWAVEVDGIAASLAMQSVVSVLMGVATVTGNTVVFMARDGTTPAVTVVVDSTTFGKRNTSTIAGE